jgi:MoaA/NifB/PqqE/SkfB family radical SAM enzyme
MCDIWKRGPGPEIEPSEYARLPSSLREINLTGGEPLVREDIDRVIAVLQERCPGARIILSTNGLLPSKLTELLDHTRGIAVRVSVDACGALHDKIRGVDGAYDRVMESLRVCKESGIKDVGICATMSKHNVGLVRHIYDLAQSLGVQFSFTVTHSSDLFFGDKREEEAEPRKAIADMKEIRKRLFRSGRPKDWFKAYFVSGLIDVVSGNPRPVRCRAGTDFFYMDPQGDFYPCHLWERKMGNILDKPFDQIVGDNGPLLDAVGKCRKRCWMTCTVAPEMRRRLVIYSAKVGWAKVMNHVDTMLGRG